MDFKFALLITVVSAPLSVFLYRQIRASLEDIQHTPEERTFTPARTGPAVPGGQTFPKAVYPIDAFPGSRQFKTVYGTIHVFEWGPEDGEKVLLLHCLGTPCIALGDMAKELVRKGYRVMIFDLFGRGYSDAPNDLVFDARLYTTQILLVLASSPLSWTGTSAFHIIGFSLGGSIAVAFAAYHATMLRSVTLVCPGGLIRTSHLKPLDKILSAIPAATVAAEVQSLVWSRVGAFASLGGIVQGKGMIPKTRSGKTLRRVLRELVENGVYGDLDRSVEVPSTVEDPTAVQVARAKVREYFNRNKGKHKAIEARETA
ncbi:hypothetical protein Aspvir_002210 [Aspergillus viridinutans]|uniref:AB hydrolase-1 domain-containing protein n=1 Tax=Aspergillus viridinutans TaxID=75553 RepID=A0A9P3C0M0_ASPVI|nr:uncharacterized protein Aspvir_002210 [Aspergillus viridinutans]GIK06560.1 hypothetical protein Aspvir_002210 [Aspergillus viridinutans]